jgi:hypothetical protein
MSEYSKFIDNIYNKIEYSDLLKQYQQNKILKDENILTCDNWSDRKSYGFTSINMDDVNDLENHNYCRNPNNDSSSGIVKDWCLVKNVKHYCDQNDYNNRKSYYTAVNKIITEDETCQNDLETINTNISQEAAQIINYNGKIDNVQQTTENIINDTDTLINNTIPNLNNSIIDLNNEYSSINNNNNVIRDNIINEEELNNGYIQDTVIVNNSIDTEENEIIRYNELITEIQNKLIILRNDVKNMSDQNKELNIFKSGAKTIIESFSNNIITNNKNYYFILIIIIIILLKLKKN